MFDKKMLLREIQYKDLERLLHLYNQLHEEDEPQHINAGVMEMWQRILDTKNHHIIVAEANNTLIAACSLTVVPNLTRGVRPYAVLENMIVDKEYRRRGYAVAVLEYTIQLAQSENCYKIMLTTRHTNEASQALYTKMGFQGDARKSFVMTLPPGK